MYFNSHAHVERDKALTGMESDGKYFNSHAHVERDMTSEDNVFRVNISTHTLTWSVTRLAQNTAVKTKFQLTRSRGA